MKLEAGKTYRSRRGTTHTVHNRGEDGMFEYCFVDKDTGDTWTETGSYYTPHDSGVQDLVEEVVAPPPARAPLKLEIGGKYRTRDAGVFRLIKKGTHDSYPWVGVGADNDVGEICFTEEGRFWTNDTSSFDIVERIDDTQPPEPPPAPEPPPPAAVQPATFGPVDVIAIIAMLGLASSGAAGKGIPKRAYDIAEGMLDERNERGFV